MSTLIYDFAPRGRVMGQQCSYVVGLDLGQKQDYTAVTLIEKSRTVYYERDAYTAEYLTDTVCRVVHAHRLPLGTSYPDVVEYVRRLLVRAPDGGRGRAAGGSLKARRLPGEMVPVKARRRAADAWVVRGCFR